MDSFRYAPSPRRETNTATSPSQAQILAQIVQAHEAFNVNPDPNSPSNFELIQRFLDIEMDPSSVRDREAELAEQGVSDPGRYALTPKLLSIAATAVSLTQGHVHVLHGLRCGTNSKYEVDRRGNLMRMLWGSKSVRNLHHAWYELRD